MSRISRVGCVRSGLGQNKAQGSPAPLPLPPRFLLAQVGDRWLWGKGAPGQEPWFPSVEMCWVQQEGPQVLEWP